MNQVAAAVVFRSSGLVPLQTHPKLVIKHLALKANGVLNLVSNRLFAVTVSNGRGKPTRLPKRMVVGITLPVPVAIIKNQAGRFPSDKEPVVAWEHEVSLRKEFEAHRKKGFGTSE